MLHLVEEHLDAEEEIVTGPLCGVAWDTLADDEWTDDVDAVVEAVLDAEREEEPAPFDVCKKCLAKVKREMEPEYEVCDRCNGHGTHVHPDLSVWTASDRYEDPDGFETMMSGGYDIQCQQCHGKRVIDVSRKLRKERARRHEDRLTQAMEDGDWETYRGLKSGLYTA